MGGRARAVIVIAVVALLAAACGSDGGGGSDQAAAGGGKLDEPVKLVFLWEIKGESAAALDDYQNGAQMAVEEINAAGGINGQPIETERIPASPLDPHKTQAAILEAQDKDPAVILGFPSSSQVIQASSTIDRGGIPTIAMSSGDAELAFGNAGSQWMWNMQPFDHGVIESGAKYLVQELGLQRIGIMGTNDSYGTNGTEEFERVLGELGAEVGPTRLYSPKATDLTVAVLAMKDQQAVVNWGFPNPLAVQLK